MSIKTIFNRNWLLLGSSAALFFTALEVAAAPGVLTELPLFVGRSTQPNIMLLTDDSGSMRANYIYNTNSGRGRSSHKDFNCPGYNAMAFDVAVARAGGYTPWKGEDKNGDVYTERGLAEANRGNPYLAGRRTDVGNNKYRVWTDNDGDGKYDGGECGPEKVVKNQPEQAVKRGYATWYTYYRTRTNVMKRAMSEIIDGSTARMGLATINSYNLQGAPVKNIDDVSLSTEQGTNAANKKALLEQLYQVRASGGTPLRKSLERVGRYYDKSASTPSGLFTETGVNSPILSLEKNGECQQNYTILMTDGARNGGSPSVGNADSYVSGSEFRTRMHADNNSNTLADVAMYYYTKDLAPGLPDGVLPSDADTNPAQHMVTYTVAFGVNGQRTTMPDIKKPDGSYVYGENLRNNFWNTSSTIDDVRHAAFNGRGDFLSARDPQQLIDALTSAVGSITDRNGSASAVAVTPSTSSQTEEDIYVATFGSRPWAGYLTAKKLKENEDTGKVSTIDDWKAADLLRDRNLSSTPRQVATYNGQRGVTFKFPSSYWSLFDNNGLPSSSVNLASSNILAPLQVQDLLKNSSHSHSTAVASERVKNTVFGQEMIRYLQGHSDDEGDNDPDSDGVEGFRERQGSRLGDIVNSSPVFVGGATNQYYDSISPNDKPYSVFAASDEVVNRTPMVYVGANDGMLHAFNAEDGVEKFAYIPGLLFSAEDKKGLHYLAEKNYAHIPYVDGTPAVQDVFIDGEWRTYLVGTLRAGGRGVFVLDVTNPDDNNASNAASWVKFEFTHEDLGHTYSDPQIVRLNNGKWAAAIGNGYNNDPGGDGRAKLFLVYLDGTGHKIIDTAVGEVVSQETCLGGVAAGDPSCIDVSDCNDVGSDCNGLSTPITLDLDNDYIPDRVYAGDVQGNMWAFDISSDDDSNWSLAHENGKPLFTACSSGLVSGKCPKARRQAITAKPSVMSHNGRRLLADAPSLLVYFGTGQFLTKLDPSNESKQAMYGVWDSGKGGLTKANLTQQTFSKKDGDRYASDLVPEFSKDDSKEMGWFIQLPDTRERSISTPVLVNNILLFNTIIPEEASCGGGGSGYFVWLDALTGGHVKLEGLDLNADGTLEEGSGYKLNSMGGSISVKGDKVIFNQSDATLTVLRFSDTRESGKRSSWTIIK